MFNNICMQVRVGSNLPLVENWTCSSKSRTRSQNLSFSNLSPKWSSLLQERVGISDQTFCLLLAHYPAPLLLLFRYLAYVDNLSYKKCDIWHKISDAWYFLHDIWCTISDNDMQNATFEYRIFDAWYLIRYLIIQYLIMQYLIIQNLITRYLIVQYLIIQYSMIQYWINWLPSYLVIHQLLIVFWFKSFAIS